MISLGETPIITKLLGIYYMATVRRTAYYIIEQHSMKCSWYDLDSNKCARI